MEMFNPPHPGLSVKHDCLEPLNLTVTRAAEWLGVGRQALSDLVNARAGVSPEMALRLEAAGWGHAESWLTMQTAYDLWHAKQQIGKRLKVKRYPVPEPA